MKWRYWTYVWSLRRNTSDLQAFVNYLSNHNRLLVQGRATWEDDLPSYLQTCPPAVRRSTFCWFCVTAARRASSLRVKPAWCLSLPQLQKQQNTNCSHVQLENTWAPVVWLKRSNEPLSSFSSPSFIFLCWSVSLFNTSSCLTPYMSNTCRVTRTNTHRHTHTRRMCLNRISSKQSRSFTLK